MIIDHWKTVAKRSHSVRVQIVQALIGLFSIFDPGIALGIWNQMPDSVASRVPPAFVATVGAVLFTLALLTIVLRFVRQPKLDAKIEEKRNGPA